MKFENKRHTVTIHTFHFITYVLRRWCINTFSDRVTFSYNKNQRDALIPKFILVKNSSCFGQIYCPSYTVIGMLYWYVCFACLALTNTYCCVYSVETPDDEQYICPKYVDFFSKINLRNSASRCLLSQEYITLHGPLNVKRVIIVS
jgi:hypothetical protein